ncbi:unnamed protein product [Sphagnum balticum]
MSSRSSTYVKANDVVMGLRWHLMIPRLRRNIIDTIIGNMLFNFANESDNDEDANVEDHVFGNEAKLDVVMHLCLEAATIAKSRALALFKQIQSEADDNVNDEEQFSYW